MNVKKYIVQFELGPATRWLIDPGAELKALQMMAENLGASFTAGPRPAVTVVLEEQPAAPDKTDAADWQSNLTTPTTSLRGSTA